MTLSDLIVSYLEQFGVEYVFGVPGSPLGPLYDALARSERRGGTRAILTRHETGGAFMADGYTRETGKIGVCCATTGPGATNLLSVPVDILRSPASGLIAFPNLHCLVTKPASVVDFVALEKLCQELYTVLSQNRKVVLLIGHDCAGATQEIITFAELIGAPIVTTQRGKSRINPYHPLARGVFGFAGHKSARKCDSASRFLHDGQGNGGQCTQNLAA